MPPKDFNELISLWPSLRDMAGDLGANLHTVRKWDQRERIPATWWPTILGTSIARVNGVTPEDLIEITRACHRKTSAQEPEGVS